LLRCPFIVESSRASSQPTFRTSLLTIRIILEARLAPIAEVHDVMGRAFKLNAKLAGRARSAGSEP
jgi:hypothetical protein